MRLGKITTASVAAACLALMIPALGEAASGPRVCAGTGKMTYTFASDGTWKISLKGTGNCAQPQTSISIKSLQGAGCFKLNCISWILQLRVTLTNPSTGATSSRDEVWDGGLDVRPVNTRVVPFVVNLLPLKPANIIGAGIIFRTSGDQCSSPSVDCYSFRWFETTRR